MRLYSIVGIGIHSEGGVQRIKPAVEELCRELNFQVLPEENPGRVYILLEPPQSAFILRTPRKKQQQTKNIFSGGSPRYVPSEQGTSDAASCGEAPFEWPTPQASSDRKKRRKKRKNENVPCSVPSSYVVFTPQVSGDKKKRKKKKKKGNDPCVPSCVVPVRHHTLEPEPEPEPDPVWYHTPESVWCCTPEPVQCHTSEPTQCHTPESVQCHTPEPVQCYAPEPVRIYTPEPVQHHTPEPVRCHTPEPVRCHTPEPVLQAHILPGDYYLSRPSPHNVTPQGLEDEEMDVQGSSLYLIFWGIWLFIFYFLGGRVDLPQESLFPLIIWGIYLLVLYRFCNYLLM